MNENEYKLSVKFPACRFAPWSFLIPIAQRAEVMRIIRQEMLDLYGQDLTECGKRMNCPGPCTGRKLPWKSPTALPYLKELAQRLNIAEGDDLFVNGCDSCPIANSCTKTCPSVNDFISRAKPLTEIKTVYKEDYTDSNIPLQDEEGLNKVNNLKLPWEILDENKVKIIKEYLYAGRDFQYIADKYNLNNAARVKYEIYAALTKLSEYGIMRRFIEENSESLTSNQYDILNSIYNGLLSRQETALKYNISKQAVTNLVTRVIENNNIKWQIFVRKKGNKVIYSTTELLK